MIQKIREFRQSKKRYMITAILAVVVLMLAGYSYWEDSDRRKLNYADSLSLVAAEVNGVSLTLRQMAFYVAFEENLVEQQALAYDATNTSKYWNLHTDGTFVRVAARNAAIQMAIHDEIFYQMAITEELSLNEDEEAFLAIAVEDFWADLTDMDKEQKLGIEKEDIEMTMRRLALAQKMQTIYAALNNGQPQDYDFYTDTYKGLYEQQDIVIYKNVWSRIRFGNITLEHEERRIKDGS